MSQFQFLLIWGAIWGFLFWNRITYGYLKMERRHYLEDFLLTGGNSFLGVMCVWVFTILCTI